MRQMDPVMRSVGKESLPVNNQLQFNFDKIEAVLFDIAENLKTMTINIRTEPPHIQIMPSATQPVVQATMPSPEIKVDVAPAKVEIQNIQFDRGLLWIALIPSVLTLFDIIIRFMHGIAP